MSVSQEKIFVGIDVGKFDFVCAVHGLNGARSWKNTEDGRAAFLSWLAGQGGDFRLGLESTGGYEYPLWIALHEAGFRVRQLASEKVKHFAGLRGQKAKTDRIDAGIIAEFLFHRPEEGRELPPENIRKISALSARRRQLITYRKAQLCQMKQAQDGEVIAMDEAFLAVIDQQIAALDIRLNELVREDADLAGKQSLISSISGLGPVSAITLIADMPELGSLSGKAAAALAGLAPYNNDSGAKTGKRFIRGGRSHVREVIYMAALSAMRFNPDMKTFADRLKAKGKPGKQVIIAVARKLIELANVILKRGTPWVHRSA